MNKQNRDFEAYVAHLLDLYKIAAFKFEPPPYSWTKFRQIKSLQKRTKSRVFVETGTYLGVTTNRCAPVFEQVYTIELDKDLAQQAKTFLSKRKNVEVIQGDAVAILPQLFSSDKVTDVLVFLDGHFSGGVTACGDQPEPAIEELKILSKVQSQVNCIIIDDFRLFGTEPGYPIKSELFQAIEQLFGNAKVSVHLDQIIIIPRGC